MICDIEFRFGNRIARFKILVGNTGKSGYLQNERLLP